MTDRLYFQQTELANGIRVYQHPMDIEYTTVFLQVPFGSAHNTAGILPGSAHFLEHVCFGSSVLYPELDSFATLVGLYGGWANATTYAFRTVYKVSVPNRHLDEVLDGLYAMVFQPLLTEEKIAKNRTIISNERQRDRWYPGSTEEGQYVRTKWQLDNPYTAEQLFGSDADLAKMSIEGLHAIHKHYLSPKIILIAVGNGKLDRLVRQLEILQVQDQSLEVAYQPLSWVRQEYHEKAFRDVQRHELRYGAIFPYDFDLQTMRRLNFIVSYLCNDTHGRLYTWLRRELGWIYEIGSSSGKTYNRYEWYIRFPLNDARQVVQVRQELWAQIAQAMKNEQAIRQEVELLLDSSTYWYETSGGILSAGLHELEDFGQIVDVAGWRRYIEGCRDVKTLQRLAEQYFNEEVTGSFCAIPEA